MYDSVRVKFKSLPLKRTVIFKAESSQENKIQKLQKNIK